MIYPSKKITVGSRESPLAKAQVKVFLDVLSNKFGVSSLKFIKSKFLKTSGDIFLNKNISEVGNKGLFTKEIDEAQLRSEIDIAVHSLKDLPTVLPKGLFIGGVLKRERPNDVIFSLKKYDIKKSSKKIILGTSSIRRKIQLMHLNKNLDVLEIRGNVGTRIKKVIDGIFDGVILAEAGLRRLNITKNYKSIDIRNIIPAVGQGVIALVIKKNKYTETLIDQINHKSTFIESDCERQFLRALDGSCKTPIGAIAKIVKRNNNKRQIFFRYMASSLDGKKIIKSKTFFDLNNYKKQSFKLGSKIKELI
ncbi:MAG: hydroxymethylbilane synthase [Alphaproteobacteria bacterium]|nr:hydroxymethylbilane synthase [Alphaproteobacteria bacterium]